ncbi:AraC family transcriptional regulator [Herbaspirillum rhizosphaerae]|uniref:AraC family transcriptional regulator n=1 Tax=Herbaspirillum rhizosphaerae TaxID=346179 RepID=UPI00067C0C23|nr:AraC family transcriptional regulator [Herbaspirillum rhizosphaerae]
MDLNDIPGDAAEFEPSAPAERSAAVNSMVDTDARLELAQRELVTLMTRLTGDADGSIETAIEGLAIHRIVNPGGPKHAVQKPAFAVIAQGSKRLYVGEDVYDYDPMHYLVSSVDLPMVGKVMISSPAQPYLGLRMELDTKEIGALIGDESLPQGIASDASRGLFVNRLNATLLDAVLRLLRLLDTPRDIPILAPMVKREILYRLLMNGQGALLRQTVLQDSQMNRIAKAIRMMKENFVQPLRVDDIARDVHMSVSSLHHHFKVVTAMSPLQYQKNLRLQEARRLILADDVSVALASQTVGYESPSQFSREYSRMFGAPPLRDKRRWLEEEAPAL